MLFDSHAHYDDGRFDPDRAETLLALPGHGICGVVNAASDMASSRAGVRLASDYDFVYAAVGVHPHDSKDMTDGDFDLLKELAKNEKVVAIGETGLDYHYDNSPREIQKKRFAGQIALAKDLNLPFIVHERDAVKDCLDILKAEGVGERGGVLHCFSGSIETAKTLLDMGMFISIGGVVTFKNARRAAEAAAYVPIDRLLIETDCPYLAPHPHRGERNSSIFLVYTAREIARLRGVDFEEIARATTKNAKEFFGLHESAAKI